jgi:hypothetical protein
MVRYLVLAAFAVTGLVVWAPPSAAAAEPVVVTGSAPHAAHGPGTVPFSYALQVARDLDSATVATHQDAFLPADATSVTFDGAAIGSADLRVSGGNLTIVLGAVPAGSHMLKFNALLQGTPSIVTSSSIDVNYVVGGAQPAVAQSAAVTVDINEPDIAVVGISDSFPFPELPFGTGVGLVPPFDFGVLNLGFGAPPTTVRITLPSGLDVLSAPCCTNNGDPFQCTHSTPGVFVCALGPLGKTLVDIGLAASASAVPGTTATIAISATPDQGVDQNPANNELRVPIKFTGTARMVTTLTPATGNITVGQSKVITVTVHNDGPQPGEFTSAFAILDDNAHFKFTAFDGRSVILPQSGDSLATLARVRARSTVVAVASAKSAAQTNAVPPEQVFWLIGTLAPGQTVTAHLTVLATSVGSTHLNVGATSTAGPAGCDPKACPTITLTAVKAAPAATPAPTPTPTTPTPTPAAAGSSGLSDSGATPWPMAWLGITFVLAGLALVRAAGSRRAAA